MEPQLNTYLGPYLLTDVIGRTNTAVVYKARQPALNRFVAVKVLRALDQRYISRFEREAQAIAQLQHRNILPIYDYGQLGPWRYFVSQYVENGTSLANLIGADFLDQAASLRLMIYVLGALEYAHSRGVFHRDVKPANILMPWPDWPLLADFGIAKLIDANLQQLTPPGQALGTPAYMAPEVGLQQVIDQRADIYSAGVVLYELLTGQLPFEASTPLAVLMKHIHDPPSAPRRLNPDIHPAAEAIVLRAIAKDPTDRYQRATDMALDIEQALKQIERSQAQAWLIGQLSSRPAVATKSRSGYTTRKLPPTAHIPAVVSGSPPRGPASMPPAATTSQPGRLRGLGVLVGLILLLGLVALLIFFARRPDSLAQAPVSPAASAPAAQPANPPPMAGNEQPRPTASPYVPPPAQPPSELPEVSQSGDVITVRLEDGTWQGGYNLSQGASRYGGRSATWIYGNTTEYSVMRVSFEVIGQPAGEAQLLIEGMDSEGRQKTPISIAVNGTEIYNGPNPLPDDDLPLETGTWASNTWSFDAAVLEPGRNQITISNLAGGTFGRPPFFMLDYAELSYHTRISK